ncbi:canalicular multispecific organic anion transporter 1 [Elysia marginata]|uniref:Canalicular multispecific organic anion transporter 1 n=1 Tax=Elysia marginata TaxID=1093978 RepID=A0AAV4JDC6_9GAST|nr:canalicular multispecific organic anion transporter 1 [Elysia marginata]
METYHVKAKTNIGPSQPGASPVPVRSQSGVFCMGRASCEKGLRFPSALISRLQYPEQFQEWQAYLLSVSLLVLGLLKSILYAQSFYRSVQIGIKTKTALTAAIYKKVLKLYAWEDEFKRKVAAIRQKEISILYKVATLYIIAGVCWSIAPFLVTMVTFTTYVLIDRNNVLDPQTAFVALALLNLLRTPMGAISTFITFTVQIMVSIKRIQKFLTLEDLDPANVDYDIQADHAIRVKKADFTWDRDLKPTLKGIDFIVPVGSLTAVVGPVGSGKTSLVCAVLGEMEKLKGSVSVKVSKWYNGTGPIKPRVYLVVTSW